MILVTVGSFQFDELVEHVDSLVASGTICEEVIAQIGSGTYIPKHITYFRHRTDIEVLYDQARLTICHGGAATVSALIRRGRPFVAFANSSLAHDHQADMLAALDRRKWCKWCHSLDDMAEAIRWALVPQVPDTHRELSRSIARFFQEQRGARRRGRRRIAVPS